MSLKISKARQDPKLPKQQGIPLPKYCPSFAMTSNLFFFYSLFGLGLVEELGIFIDWQQHNGGY